MIGRPHAGRFSSSCVFITLAILLLVLPSWIALAQPTTYGGVTFPNGDVSFADRVVSYVPASCADSVYANPQAALGPPDCSKEEVCSGCNGCGPCAVALGFRLSTLDKRGSLVLEFVDNVLTNVPGDDLYVYITNGKACDVAISQDGKTFVHVGTVSGYPGGLDIASVAKDGETFRFVRLTDVPADENRSPCPGPSIDAVGAMGEARQVSEQGKAFGSLELLPAGGLSVFGGAPPQDLLIILDTSSSMADSFENSTKIAVAKQVLEDVVADLPDNMDVGLRIFGGCEYSQLLRPIETLDKTALKAQIGSIETGGPTPIAYTLEQAKTDFANVSGTKLILLVSDGMETCKGDPVAAAKALLAAGYKMRIDVVGFDVAGQPAAREQLQEIAKVTNGTFYSAQSSQELRAALKTSIAITYHVYDSQGNEVFSGEVGKSGPQLPPGTYKVVLDTPTPVTVDNVVVESGQKTQIEVNRSDGSYTTSIKK
jgi:hypothetical protein